ncbi:MAG TPA: DNA polymerase III subunit gamma/tau [Candidatus Saccharimonadales bacterium]|jgi:DNA polymerase-3 subunit gamma/tau|nr:DNA polymerase III subunit gamma/tau [Candidatus Saccharimonadales bacterium]
MTLYLKYRPKNLDELDLRDVGESLKKISSKTSMPHAFLFAGPKGTGKTSAARILAKIVNCESKNPPCGKCEQCISIDKGNNLDVIEMDAASHRGIDDVRILRDAVKLAPVAAKKKVYIIDEAHMLTTEASNALLKTLEEPPEHVIFILATTNPEKLIDTIKSRTTYIPFRKANPEEIVRSLKRVVLGEKIKIDDGTLKIIAEASDGSFRDGIKILEQLVAEDAELTKEFLEEFLFSKKAFDSDKFISLLIKKDAKSLIEEIGKLGAKGVVIETFLDSVLRKLRTSLLAKVGIGTDEIGTINKIDLISLIELLTGALRDMADSLIEELPLEIAVIKWCGEGNGGHQSESVHSEQNSPSGEAGTSRDNSRSETLVDRGLAQTVAPVVRRQPAVDVVTGEGVNDEVWRNILSLIKPINASIEALLRSSKPITYDGKVLTLGVYYKFHKERLEDSQHRRILEDIVAKVLQSPTKVVCVLVDPPPRKVIEETKVEAVLTEGKDKDIIKAAEEIFGN